MFTLRKISSVMNESKDAALAHQVDQSIIIAALAALREASGVDGELLNQAQGGPTIMLRAAGKALRYTCDVKQKIDRFATLSDLHARSVLHDGALLICGPLTSAMAERCRQLGMQFIDTAGNAYLNDGKGFLIYIEGRKSAQTNSARRDATVTPAVLRLMFGALAQPSLLNAPYRDIAKAVGISIGAIAKAFDTLEAAGFIGTTATGARMIRTPERMLSEWATGYLQRLRPQLEKYRFTAPQPSDIVSAWTPEYRVSAWGGEPAAAIASSSGLPDTIAEAIKAGHLKPATYTLYMESVHSKVLSELVRSCRLRADPNGPIEIVKAFWNMDRFADAFPTVPLHLIYADLLETNDPRNLAVAQLIAQKVVNHVHNAQGQTA